MLASKRAANREKDKLVIPVLEDSIAAQQLGGPALQEPIEDSQV